MVFSKSGAFRFGSVVASEIADDSFCLAGLFGLLVLLFKTCLAAKALNSGKKLTKFFVIEISRLTGFL